ncbi:hypothetical protein [Litorilituus sediminis]|uniref:Type IV pilus biogenesis protein PilP n=1 Tax=Litorilituus sediminis TaxID=718192 RepID=A0A4P6P9F8_9GAMM|nr:hypothetical protein [Litorilituus sediminis]QBG36232.1 hypothetical protein EMK97_11155 [Litorilituus sediminis]
MKNYKKKMAVLLSSCVLSVPVFSAEISTELQQCAQVTDNFARLTCFDKLAIKHSGKTVAPAKAAVPKPPKSAEIVAPVSKPKPTVKQATTSKEVDEFAKNHLARTSEQRAQELTEISAKIAKLDKTARGLWKISLDNGQQWQQKESYSFSLQVGQDVVLSKGALGAIYLSKVGSNRRIRVRRLK